MHVFYLWYNALDKPAYYCACLGILFETVSNFIRGAQHAVEQELLPTLAQHYEIALAHGRKEAVMAVETQMPDLVLLDVPSVRFDTTRFCEDLKQRWPSLPLFFLLGKGMRLDKFPRAHGFLTSPLHTASASPPPLTGSPGMQWRGGCLAWLAVGRGRIFADLGHGDYFPYAKQAALALAFLRAPRKRSPGPS